MAGWRRSELKAGVYDEIVSARLDRQLAALGAPFEVYRSALTVSEPIGAVPTPTREISMSVGPSRRRSMTV